MQASYDQLQSESNDPSITSHAAEKTRTPESIRGSQSKTESDLSMFSEKEAVATEQ
jgi:hypothetical protein